MTRLILKLALAAFGVALLPNTANSGTVKGRVLDAESGIPVKYAEVMIANEADQRFGGVSGDEGFFIISNVIPGG